MLFLFLVGLALIIPGLAIPVFSKIFCRSDTDIAIAIMDHSTFNRHCTNYFASRIVILATAIQPDPL